MWCVYESIYLSIKLNLLYHWLGPLCHNLAAHAYCHIIQRHGKWLKNLTLTLSQNTFFNCLNKNEICENQPRFWIGCHIITRLIVPGKSNDTPRQNQTFSCQYWICVKLLFDANKEQQVIIKWNEFKHIFRLNLLTHVITSSSLIVTTNPNLLFDNKFRN